MFSLVIRSALTSRLAWSAEATLACGCGSVSVFVVAAAVSTAAAQGCGVEDELENVLIVKARRMRRPQKICIVESSVKDVNSKAKMRRQTTMPLKLPLVALAAEW